MTLNDMTGDDCQVLQAISTTFKGLILQETQVLGLISLEK